MNKLLRGGLQTKLVAIFLTLTLVTIAAIGLLAFNRGRAALRQNAGDSLLQTATIVGDSVSRFITDRHSDIQLLAESPILRAESASLADKQAFLESVGSTYTWYNALYFIDTSGAIVVASDNTTGDMSSYDWFQDALSGEVVVTDVYYLFAARGTVITLAALVTDFDGQPVGVLASQFAMPALWEFINEEKVINESGFVMLVDQHGRIISHPDPAVVFEEASRSMPDVALHGERGFVEDTADDGVSRLYGFAPIQKLDDSLGKSWTVVAVIPTEEVFRPINQLGSQITMMAIVLAAITSLLTLLVARNITRPVLKLAAAAQAIRAGDLSWQVEVSSQDEIGFLAASFNSMTGNLRQRIEAEQEASEIAAKLAQAEREAKEYLEQTVDHYLAFIEQVAAGDLTARLSLNGDNDALTILGRNLNNMAERLGEMTTQLKTVALLSERLAAILDFDQLLVELVNQVKDSFDYYHAHIYILTEDTSDEGQRTLVMRAGAGEAGEKMKATGHYIPLDAPTSLVARAAHSGEVVRVDNVRESADWLPNPLLPDTYAEMAVPIIVEGQVVGVLDVQADKIGGLDESDANLLRSLANHVAVALTNARLFEQTVQTKEEAEMAKEKAEQAREEAEVANEALGAQIWQTAGQAQLSDKIRGEQDIPILANRVIRQLCQYLEAQIGALYVTEDSTLNLTGSYAYTSQDPTKQFKFGEGMVGQAALEKQPLIVTNVPEDCITTRSALGEIVPRNIMLFPFMYEDQVVGVIEMGTLTKFSLAQMEFIQTAIDSIAIAFNTAQARARIDELLSETQQQAEELQAQSEELQVANEELESQTESLRLSEAKLKEKQAAVDRQNRDLKTAQQELEQQAEELALASKYKSEFLANMSHELRTPLNSMLILARILADNKEGNLTGDQVESAQIMYSGGTDLLNLINDILDLSKVEAGQMLFNFESMPLADLVSTVRLQFDHVAEEKELDLNITLADDLPPCIETDQQRVKQIVKNLLSNAFKFTNEGSVSLDVYRPNVEVDLSHRGLDPAQAIAIRVTDTGIGIATEQQKVIFEAFQQADGSTNRQYGGTGLGLSISRELASNLGGQIDVESEQGKGSTFTLYLPIERKGEAQRSRGAEEQRSRDAGEQRHVSPFPPGPPAPQPPNPPTPQPSPPPAQPSPPDDRDSLGDDDKILLVIEDDPKFAKIMYDYAHEKTFKCLIAGDGQTGLELAKTHQPEAVILDLNLPDISGWKVLENLKNDPGMRHIPVHIISADEGGVDAYRKGAMGYLTKPVSQKHLDEAFQEIEHFISKEIKALLLVEDDKKARRSIKKLLNGSDVKISEAELGQTALDLLQAQHFDCMILDLNLPDMTGFEVLNKMDDAEAVTKCPVIVYTGRDLTPEENLELMKYADRVIVKGVKSPERLLDETALFLHRVVAEMPKDKQQTIKQLYNTDGLLKDKKILIVDDDMRNSFALSKLLSDKGITVKITRDGQKALDLLAEDPEVDLILMDIMMPVMDGYEAIERIRAQRKFKTLPILALTAKAMKGDREKCLAAGANDYLPKPVDVDRLFSMLRVWLQGVPEK